MLIAVVIGLAALFCCILITPPRKRQQHRRPCRDVSGANDNGFSGDHGGSHHGRRIILAVIQALTEAMMAVRLTTVTTVMEVAEAISTTCRRN